MLISLIILLFVALMLAMAIFRGLLYTIVNFLTSIGDWFARTFGKKRDGATHVDSRYQASGKSQSKKIFNENDGEYVDYEEIDK